MAHDIENEIRQKVWAAEASPLAWRKEQAWRHIQMAPARIVSPKAIYYTAAAVLIGVVTILYLLQQNLNQATELRIRSLELAINDRMKETQIITIIPVQAVEEVKCLSLPLAIQQPGKKTPSGNSKITFKKSKIPSEILPSIAETPPLTSKPAEIPNEVTEIPERLPVQAIVGIIPEKQIRVAKSGKKIKIRLITLPDLGPGQSKAEENSLLTARIK